MKRLITTGLVSTFFLFTGVAQAATAVSLSDLDAGPTATAVTNGSGKWFMYNDTLDTIDNTLGNFVVGPGGVLNGTGSIEFTLAASPLDRKNIATFQFSGIPLSSISAMSFGVYSYGGTGGAGVSESPYLNFNVDFTGSSGSFQKRLVYVPSGNGPVLQNTWNDNDAIQGGSAKWVYSGATWPAPNSQSGATFKTWTQILTDYPDARLLPVGGWLGIRVGEPGPTGYVANVDYFSITVNGAQTTFDFDPASTIDVTGDTVDLASSGTGEVALQSGATEITLDNTSVLNLAAGVEAVTDSVTVGGNLVELTQAVTLQSGVDNEPVELTNNNVTISIPDATEISGPAGWDKTLVAQVVTASGDAPTGFSVGGTVIEVGSPSVTLVVDKPVTITLTGVTGPVGYKSGGSNTWVQITNTCGTDYNNPTDPGSPNECAINNGTDTKILTYHFTSFGSLTVLAPVVETVTAPRPPSRRSGGGAVLAQASAPVNIGAGEVLGAFTGPANELEVVMIKAKLVSLIRELISLLQAQLAAAIASGSY